jgi:hypothetical protein
MLFFSEAKIDENSVYKSYGEMSFLKVSQKSGHKSVCTAVQITKILTARDVPFNSSWLT